MVAEFVAFEKVFIYQLFETLNLNNNDVKDFFKYLLKVK